MRASSRNSTSRAVTSTTAGCPPSSHICAAQLRFDEVNLRAISTYLGDASTTITLDRHGHLVPGTENEVAELLDRYLVGAQTGAQGAQTVSPSRTDGVFKSVRSGNPRLTRCDSGAAPTSSGRSDVDSSAASSMFGTPVGEVLT